MKKIVIKDVKTKKHFLNEFKKKEKWIIFYNWDNCGFCHRIRPVWDNFVSNNKNINFAEIERSQFINMSLFLKKINEVIPHFPYFVEYINKNNTTTKKTIDNLEHYIQKINTKQKKYTTKSYNQKGKYRKTQKKKRGGVVNL